MDSKDERSLSTKADEIEKSNKWHRRHVGVHGDKGKTRRRRKIDYREEVE